MEQLLQYKQMENKTMNSKENKTIAKAYIKVEPIYNDRVIKYINWLNIATLLNSISIITIILQQEGII